jgi:phosphoribosyl 1,2-cyclic phosphate phosphodiesterase
MRITFLGSGTSQGVPVIACNCAVCTSTDKRDNRLRSSILIETKEATIVVDTGPDFRYQMLRQKVHKLDAILFTHGHKDHTAGLDDVRAYNYFQNKEMDIYASLETQEVLRREFQYIFLNSSYPGVPQIIMHNLYNETFCINGLSILPIRVLHYHLEVYGFRIGDFTYITDANFIDQAEKEKIKGSKVLVLNALRKEKHISHFTLNEALELAAELNCQQTYLTHISHQLGLHNDVNLELPDGVQLAFDGLSFEM